MHHLVWFRRDLRVLDHSALFHACKPGQRVIALFMLTPQRWQKHHVSANQVDFILRQLEDLKQSLSALHIPLLIVDEAPDIIHAIKTIHQHHPLKTVHTNAVYEHVEQQEQQRLSAFLQTEGIADHWYDDRLLVPANQIQTGAGTPYTVFTPFKNKLIKHLGMHGIPEPFPKPAIQQPIKNLPASTVPTQLDAFSSHIDAHLWPTGEDVAHQKLDTFVQHPIKHYQKQRDFPAIDGTSRLSAYLAIGVLSVRQCLYAAMMQNQGHLSGHDSHIECWISELIWREFYTHILIHFPQVCRNQPFKAQARQIPWNNDPQLLDQWKHGRTGIPIIDAAMRQLVQTGWMHNRLRMVTAMFLCKNCLIDWRLGEAYFMQHLIDGDFASNNGGWQWAASTGTDAAPYFRIMNPVSQSQKFDSQGDFIRRFCPELTSLTAKQIHHPSQLAPAQLGTYPAASVDLKQSRAHAIEVFKRALSSTNQPPQ